MGAELKGWMIIAGVAGVIVLFMIVVGLMVAKWYKRASADEAIVRTGKGGMQVSIGGGMFIVPILHEVMKVSLRTIVLNVRREGRQALVTKDKIKACCSMELYIKVDPTIEAIQQAAQSFGNKNVDAEALKDIVEGKLTDALRGVAANQDFSELHANRESFAEEVKKALVEELKKNGLKLESTSLTELSQLPQSEMDPNDVFDAEGLQNIAVTVAKAQKEVNSINNDKTVTIKQQNVAARKATLELEQEQKFLEADQTRKVEEYQATQDTEKTKAVLSQQQAAREAELEQHRIVEQARIAQEEQVATRDLQRQRAIAEETAMKQEAEQTAQIKASRAVETANIEKAKAVEAATIEKQQTIETATIKKQQAIALADAEKAAAEAQKNLAEAEEAAAKEKITTARETAQAEREKNIQIIKSEEDAQKDKIEADKDAYTARVKAEADLVVEKNRAEGEKARAEGVANAVREKARAEAERVTVTATADKDAAALKAEADALQITRKAEAEKIAALQDAEAKLALAEAIRKEGEARAEARKKLVEAENAVDSRLLIRDAALQAIKVSPDLVREFVKSAEAIGEIKVVQIDGSLGGGDGSGSSELLKTPLGIGLTTLLQSTAMLPAAKALMDLNGVDTAAIADRLKDAAKGVGEALKNPATTALHSAAAGAAAGATASMTAAKPSKSKPKPTN